MVKLPRYRQDGEADSEWAVRVLCYRGYDLHKLDPASMGQRGDDLRTGP